MAAAAIALAGFQIASGLQQAELTRDTGDLIKQVNELNAKYAETDAFESLARGLTEEARYSNVVASVTARQKSNFEAAGVDSSYGSAADVQSDAKVQGIINQATIKNNSYAASLGLKREALNIRTQGAIQAAQNSAKASAQQAAGIMNGISTGLSAYTNGAGGTDAGTGDHVQENFNPDNAQSGGVAGGNGLLNY